MTEKHLPQIGPVDAAIGKLATQISAVETETVATIDAAGRVLSQPLLADRDSPALDVSAMDGYAIRFSDLKTGSTSGDFPVSGTAAAGAPPASLPPGCTIKIFTGAPVPDESDLVIKREDTTESEGKVSIRLPRSEYKVGQHIRPKGENSRKGTPILDAGTLITPAAMGALAAFAGKSTQVHRKIRVTILNTGDELASIGEAISDWQIRDSNGPVLESWIGSKNWLEIIDQRHVADEFATVVQQLDECAQIADAVILTGGVSMGDADYVPDALKTLGGNVAFHRLPIRPGKPILGGTLNGKLILGLPGNPVSVAVTALVIGLPLLSKLAGIRTNSTSQTQVRLSNHDAKSLDLTWYRLVRHNEAGEIELIPSRGSGDLVSLAASHGVVKIPPMQIGPGPWHLYRW